MTDRNTDLFADADLDLPPGAGHEPDLFAFALNLYRTPLQYLPLIGIERPLPAGLSRCLEVLNKPEDASVWADLAERQGAPAGELRSATFFLVRRLLFAEGADHYRVLGLDADADSDRIKGHYRLLMALFHPDRNPEGDEWNQLYAPKINDAYNILKNKEKKSLYDRRIRRREVSDRGRAGGGEPASRRRIRGGGPGPDLVGNGGRRQVSVLVRHWRVGVWVAVLVLGLLAAVGVVQRHPETLKVANIPDPGQSTGQEGEFRQTWQKEADEALGMALARASQPVSLTLRRVDRETPATAVRKENEGAPVAPAVVEVPPVVAESGDAVEDEEEVGSRPAEPVAEPVDNKVEEKRMAAVTGSATVQASVPPVIGTIPEPKPRPPGRGQTLARVRDVDGERARKPTPAPVVERSWRHGSPSAPVEAGRPAVVTTPAGAKLIERAQRTTEISQAGVDLLLARFIEAYEAGDTDGFADLFDDRAVTDDGVGQGIVRRQYGELFRTSSRRAMSIDKVAWRGDGKRRAIVFGLARVEVQNSGSRVKTHYLGGMMMRVYKGDRALKIFELHHRLERQ